MSRYKNRPAKQERFHRRTQEAERAASHFAAEGHRALVVSTTLMTALHHVLNVSVAVAEIHAPVTKTVKGVEKKMCPVCKVVAPCKTFESVYRLGPEVEEMLNPVMDRLKSEMEQQDATTPQGQAQATD